MKLVSRMICKECAKTNLILQKAWDLAMIATPAEDCIPCWICKLPYQRYPEKDRGWIMDCTIPENL